MISVADFPEVPATRDPLTDRILGLAIEVHKVLGPGLLESAYCACLAREMDLAKLSFRREVEMPLSYKGLIVSTAYRLDFLVQDQIVLEIKAVERLEDVHEAQLLTYLRLSGKRTGLLLNFNEKLLKNGILRRVL